MDFQSSNARSRNARLELIRAALGEAPQVPPVPSSQVLWDAVGEDLVSAMPQHGSFAHSLSLLHIGTAIH